MTSAYLQNTNISSIIDVIICFKGKKCIFFIIYQDIDDKHLIILHPILWVLMPWRWKEPGHQQPQYWQSSIIVQPQYHQSWNFYSSHDDVIKWKHFPHYWPFVRGIHRSPVNSPHKGQWRGALMFSLICVWINGWVNNREAGDLRRYCAHYDITVMSISVWIWIREVFHYTWRAPSISWYPIFADENSIMISWQPLCSKLNDGSASMKRSHQLIF